MRNLNEWIDANNLGGYASSTLAMVPTRRNHGLLVAGFPDFERLLVVSGLQEKVNSKAIDGESLSEFRFNLVPTFIYKSGDVKATRQIFMVQDKNITIISYQFEDPEGRDIDFEVKPIIGIRKINSLLVFDDLKNFEENFFRDCVSIIFQNQKSIRLNMFHQDFLYNSKTEYSDTGYPVDEERGSDFREKLLIPGIFSLKAKSGRTYNLVFSTDRENFIDIRKIAGNEATRRIEIKKNSFTRDVQAEKLFVTSQSFMLSRPPNIIAGYQDAYVKGRDALMSVPGLLLINKNYGHARNVLKYYASLCKDGILPDSFESGAAKYNSADISLWFIIAAYKYIQYSSDWRFVKECLWDAVKKIFDYYQKGAIFPASSSEHAGALIKADDDGLLLLNSKKAGLTWMDPLDRDPMDSGPMDGENTIARNGKVVEMEALWYNCARIVELFAAKFSEINYQVRAEDSGELIKDNFFKLFWNENKKCLYDFINGGIKDESVRPNQIFVLSLPFDDIVPEDKKRIILQTLERKLLTEAGLRTLSVDDPQYVGKISKNFSNFKDRYKGSAWPFLLGPFITAYVKVNNYSDVSVKKSAEFLKPILEKYMKEPCQDSISEFFDGDAPHSPAGCPSHALAVAEILRVIYEDIPQAFINFLNSGID